MKKQNSRKYLKLYKKDIDRDIDRDIVSILK